LTPNANQAFLKLDPGSGPRHLVFHPNGEFAYVVSELNSTVTACSYDGSNGVLKALNTVSTVPESHPGSKYPAAIRIHPNGAFVYASTRGDESSIAVYQVEESGGIHRIQVTKDVPAWPRDFNIDPSGKFLIVAGERSNEIELFSIDSRNGEISSMNSKIELPAPGCVLYIE
jgi:6-phosphogluconolactonase